MIRITGRFLLFLLAANSSAIADQLVPGDAIRCFFVYTPIMQAGRDLGRADIASFGQKRMSVIYGYLKACEQNPSCKADADQIFRNTEELTRDSNSLEDQFKYSIRTGDQAAFHGVIHQARLCDEKVGLTDTTDVPSFNGAGSEVECQTDDELRGTIITGYFLAELTRAEMCSGILSDKSVLEKHNLLRRKFHKEIAPALTSAQSLYAAKYGSKWKGRWESDMANVKSQVIQREKPEMTPKKCKSLAVGYDLSLQSGSWSDFDNTIFKSQFAHLRRQVPRCQ